MMELLKKMCEIRSVSGDELLISNFLIDYINEHKNTWATTPTVYYGDEFQHCIVLVFGKPRTAIFSHIDSIGFTTRYNNQLVKIGSPRTFAGTKLVGNDSIGEIECILKVENEIQLSAVFNRDIERGTNLTFKPNWRETNEYVQCCYMDNRLGIWNALKVAETLTDGIIAFTCWEEHGGGSVSYLQKFIYDNFKVKQALISDITWVTDGISPGKGIAISMRDSLIPRRVYLNKIINIAKKSGLPFQLEVEATGGSDAKELQASTNPWDWCFVGAPEENVHSADEKVNKSDIDTMVKMYKLLMKEL